MPHSELEKQAPQHTPVMCIGIKMVEAQPMTRGQYNTYRGWTMPEGETASDDGYLVVYQDGGKPNDPRHSGYISWTPKEQFDNAYRPLPPNVTGSGQQLFYDDLKAAMFSALGQPIF